MHSKYNQNINYNRKQIIKKSHTKKVNVIIQESDLSHSTVSNVLKNKEHISKGSVPMSSTHCSWNNGKYPSMKCNPVNWGANKRTNTHIQWLSTTITTIKQRSLLNCLKTSLNRFILHICVSPNCIPLKILLLSNNAPGHPLIRTTFILISRLFTYLITLQYLFNTWIRCHCSIQSLLTYGVHCSNHHCNSHRCDFWKTTVFSRVTWILLQHEKRLKSVWLGYGRKNTQEDFKEEES